VIKGKKNCDAVGLKVKTIVIKGKKNCDAVRLKVKIIVIKRIGLWYSGTSMLKMVKVRILRLKVKGIVIKGEFSFENILPLW